MGLRLLSVHQRDSRDPLGDKTRTGNQNFVVAGHRISSRVQASRVTEMPREEPLQVNKSISTSSMDPPLLIVKRVQRGSDLNLL